MAARPAASCPPQRSARRDAGTGLLPLAAWGQVPDGRELGSSTMQPPRYSVILSQDPLLNRNSPLVPPYPHACLI